MIDHVTEVEITSDYTLKTAIDKAIFDAYYDAEELFTLRLLINDYNNNNNNNSNTSFYQNNTINQFGPVKFEENSFQCYECGGHFYKTNRQLSGEI